MTVAASNPSPPPPATAARRRRRRDDLHATIVDVAARAGVSTATASRALNTPTLVSDALRARVSAAAAALAYVPDPAARSLASRRSGLIGIVAGDLCDGATAACVGALQPQLAAAGYASLLAVAGSDGEGFHGAVAGLAAHAVEAVVLVGCRTGASGRSIEAGRGVPVVHVGAAPADVGIDTAIAGATIARYLLSLGHTRLGWVATDREPAWWAAGLRDGFAAALVAAGGRAPVRFVVSSNRGTDAVRAGLPVTEALPTALVCADDLLALTVVRALAGQAVSVPRHVSVVGCGDQPAARQAHPPLTSLRLPTMQLATSAVDRVLARLCGEARRPRAVVAKLVIRASTGPAFPRD
jgi:DNA-binding LacI/PurR family transcriptional regulator